MHIQDCSSCFRLKILQNLQEGSLQIIKKDPCRIQYLYLYTQALVCHFKDAKEHHSTIKECGAKPDNTMSQLGMARHHFNTQILNGAALKLCMATQRSA